MHTKDTPRPSADFPGNGGDQRSEGAFAADAKQTVTREMHDARDRLAGAAEEVRHEAAGASGTISRLVSEQAERRKEEAADGLRSFADAIRSAADELGERDRSMSARLVQEAARGLEQLSGGLQARSVREMAGTVTAFGRDNPATFLTGCLLAGVALGRFFTASSGRAHDMDGGPNGGPNGGDRFGAAGDAWRDDGFDAARGAAGGPAYPGAARPRRDLGGENVAGPTDPADRGSWGDASGLAGSFGGGTISPSSAERAPGDNDPLGTAVDAPEPALTSDAGLGERPGVPGVGLGFDEATEASDRAKGGRDGDL